MNVRQSNRWEIAQVKGIDAIKTERDLGVQSAGKFDDSELDSTSPSPYLTNVCEAVELVFKVLAASSAVPNSQTVRH